MKQICFLVLAVLMLAGCSASPAGDAELPTVPPSTLQTLSDSEIDSITARIEKEDYAVDDDIMALTEYMVQSNYEDHHLPLPIMSIVLENSVVIQRYISIGQITDSINDKMQFSDLYSSVEHFISGSSGVFYAFYGKCGRDDLDCVVQLMSDEDPSIPLISAINGITFYEAGEDDPSDAAFDPAHYSVRALAAAVAIKAADRSDDDFRVSDLRVQSNTIVLDISTPNGLRAYVQAQNPENAPVWKTYRSAFAGFTRAAHEYCASRGREDVSVVVRVLNDAEPVDPLIVACDGEITTDNTLWRTLEGWNSMKGETAP